MRTESTDVDHVASYLLAFLVLDGHEDHVLPVLAHVGVLDRTLDVKR